MKALRALNSIIGALVGLILVLPAFAVDIPTEPRGAQPPLATLTPNNTSPYVTSTTDLRKGCVSCTRTHIL